MQSIRQSTVSVLPIFILMSAKLVFVPPASCQTLPMFKSDLFAASGDCAFCHTTLVDEAGHDVSIDSHWRSTMMANAAKDPYYLAKVTSESARFPELREVIEETCARCHMPMAYTEATAAGEPVSIFGDGFLNAGHELHTLASDGVSCAVCHQIQDIDLGERASFSGGFRIDLLLRQPNRLIYGPFQNPLEDLMRNVSGYAPVFGEQISESALCATCHTLYTPFLDESGTIAGEYPEQTVFLEWRHSEYGDGIGTDTSCQDCHMPKADGGVVTSIIPPGSPAREPFSQHHFVGGNAFMLKLMKRNRTELGITANEDHMQATLERTVAQLQQNTATMEITDARVSTGTLHVDLTVRAMTGHKFPTGYPARRTWIHYTVTDGDGTVVFESGRPKEDGRIAGNNADEEPSSYEPHYDLIDVSDAVQIYEVVMGNSTGDVTYTLLSAAANLKDNRLLPGGFDKQTANPDFAVWGAALGDENFVGGSDQIRYEVDVSAYQGPFSVQAELLLQSVAFPFVRDLEEFQTPEVDRFVTMYRSEDQTPVVVSSATAQNVPGEASVPGWRSH